MSERQCREALLRLPAGREERSCRRQLPSLPHLLSQRHLRLPRSPSGRHAGGARSCNTGGSRRFPASPAAPATSTATQAAAKPAAPVASTPPAAAAKPAAVKPAAPAAPPAKSAAKPPASAPVPAAAPPAVIVVAPRQVFVLAQMPCRVPRLLLRCGHRGRPRGCLPAIERRVAFTNLPKRLGRVGPLRTARDTIGETNETAFPIGVASRAPTILLASARPSDSLRPAIRFA